VKTQSFVDVRRRHHWRRTLLVGVASEDPSQPVAMVVVGWWCCLVCCGCGGALAPCWQGGVEGPWGVALGWRTWCSGDLGDG
jgi:hypothetical protein